MNRERGKLRKLSYCNFKNSTSHKRETTSEYELFDISILLFLQNFEQLWALTSISSLRFHDSKMTMNVRNFNYLDDSKFIIIKWNFRRITKYFEAHFKCYLIFPLNLLDLIASLSYARYFQPTLALRGVFRNQIQRTKRPITLAWQLSSK